MSAIMRVSVLTWDSLHQLATITPNDIIEITAAVGKTIEDLAEFLEKRFPDITAQMAERYLSIVIHEMLPTSSLPTKEEVLEFIQDLRSRGAGSQFIRDQTVEHFYGVVNRESPEYAKRMMMALIEFALAEDWISVLNEAGFAQCNFEDQDFDQTMQQSTADAGLNTLLSSERKKAEVLIQIITERRLVA
jgi:hypothetical protein